MESIDGVVEPDVVEARAHGLSNEIQPLTLQAATMAKVTTVEERHTAETFLHDVKDRIDAVNEAKEFFAKPARDLARKYSAYFKPMLDALIGLEREIKRGIGKFDLEQRNKARDAERKAILAAQAEERKREKKAEKAEARGNHELAADLRNTPVIPVAPPPVPKLSSSTTTRIKYVARVVSEEQVPRRFLIPDERALNNFAARYKDSEPPKVPGVLWEARPIVTARR